MLFFSVCLCSLVVVVSDVGGKVVGVVKVGFVSRVRVDVMVRMW